MCVPCAPGSYHSLATSQCELCPEGEYQHLTGRTECFKCPEGHITAGEGAINENECKGDWITTVLPESTRKRPISSVNCPAGNYFDMASSLCTPCGFGFFQPRAGSFECLACDVGKTTMSEAATTEEECRDECPGTTTESVASTRREQCNTPRCKPGQFLVKETKHCQFCPRGTFQDEEQRTTCKLCPTDHTTASQGGVFQSKAIVSCASYV
ncbi:GCC2 and GCC3 [Ancylostoma duodenale]|uniref:GCC2 and GCC3 n=1 Tax=Ancylostoma duodenale TaxID=51022 RepID=A0A0C2C049_9BILA|nr:GCC2 and GCC3 [Ancylostoma duodenale]